MTDSRRAMEIFDEVVGLDPAARPARLNELCGDDSELRAQVERMLDSDARKSVSEALRGATRATEAEDPLIGLRIDRYTLKRRLGAGGFGMVYVAREEGRVRRDVAIKLLQPEKLESRRVRRRFEVECETLKYLSHPHIARLYDAGTSDQGWPFLVMELIKGEPITSFCDSHRLGIESRIRLFVKVCHAVRYAHDRGIIHRDLKPDNVLVAMEDGEPIPKIIDFGIAKAVQPEILGLSSDQHTGEGPGTPVYQSPEQASGSPLAASTQSDVYSLGVLLYEILAGVLPFDAGRRRAATTTGIGTLSEPTAPTVRLRQVQRDAPSKLESIAQARQLDPESLILRLKQELEWIPLMASRNEPDRRYHGAGELAADLDAFLRGEALQAGPESRGYRARKFLRRHKGPVVAITAIMLLLAAGFLITSVLLDRAVTAERTQVRSRLTESDDLGVAAWQASHDSIFIVSQDGSTKSVPVPSGSHPGSVPFIAPRSRWLSVQMHDFSVSYLDLTAELPRWHRMPAPVPGAVSRREVIGGTHDLVAVSTGTDEWFVGYPGTETWLSCGKVSGSFTRVECLEEEVLIVDETGIRFVPLSWKLAKERVQHMLGMATDYFEPRKEPSR